MFGIPITAVKRLIQEKRAEEGDDWWVLERSRAELTEQRERGYDLYQHYKGDIYRKIADARSSENRSEELVVYQSCKTGAIWVRPKAIFEEILPDGTPRFRKAEKTEQRGVTSAEEFLLKHNITGGQLFQPRSAKHEWRLTEIMEAYASSRLAAQLEPVEA
jgi:hypothetical protein